MERWWKWIFCSRQAPCGTFFAPMSVALVSGELYQMRTKCPGWVKDGSGPAGSHVVLRPIADIVRQPSHVRKVPDPEVIAAYFEAILWHGPRWSVPLPRPPRPPCKTGKRPAGGGARVSIQYSVAPYCKR